MKVSTYFVVAQHLVSVSLYFNCYFCNAFDATAMQVLDIECSNKRRLHTPHTCTFYLLRLYCSILCCGEKICETKNKIVKKQKQQLMYMYTITHSLTTTFGSFTSLTFQITFGVVHSTFSILFIAHFRSDAIHKLRKLKRRK